MCSTEAVHVKTRRILIVSFHLIIDGADQLRHVREAAAADPLVCDFAKPPFDQVQPGAGRWNEVQMKAWMAPQPGFHGDACGFRSCPR